MRRKIGTKDGHAVYAIYTHEPGSLPRLIVSKVTWRGSSLGPSNPWVTDDSDIRYWSSIARDEKLID